MDFTLLQFTESDDANTHIYTVEDFDQYRTPGYHRGFRLGTSQYMTSTQVSVMIPAATANHIIRVVLSVCDGGDGSEYSEVESWARLPDGQIRVGTWSLPDPDSLVQDILFKIQWKM
jgi:hypothetical protein